MPYFWFPTSPTVCDALVGTCVTAVLTQTLPPLNLGLLIDCTQVITSCGWDSNYNIIYMTSGMDHLSKSIVKLTPSFVKEIYILSLFQLELGKIKFPPTQSSINSREAIYFLYMEDLFFSRCYLRIEKTVGHCSLSAAGVECWAPWKSYVNIYARPAGNVVDWQAFL